ncbi:MAG: hypothetical protein JKY08_09925 [Flavobacteriaceae bacterium]|nr:hypothetical protein [Flavobacteriaceae bacterium]
MTNTQNFPKFLSNKPSGIDSFKGGSQEKLSLKICETINSDFKDNKIIGIEGGWGSGKSNVVEMVRNKLSKSHYMFVYDAWGNQEDLTRKTFLEQILDELFNENLLKNSDYWNKKENELFSKTTTKHTEKHPVIRSYIILFTLAVICYGFTSSMYKFIPEDFIPIWNFGVWKPLISILLVPLVLLSIGISFFLKEYRRLQNINSKKSRKTKEASFIILGKMFYWINGKDLESSVVENILESETSVLKFREYFKAIEKDLENKKLVVVFDNLDRLSAEKISALWSSIHTFFADSKESLDSWVIIPFNKQELENQEINISFLEKSISINFQVTPPVVSGWEKFLQDKINEAFEIDFINEHEVSYIKQIFDIELNDDVIKPRQIINYINGIVSLYKQRDEEVSEGKISFRYLALYYFVKDKINKSPNESILTRSYLSDGNMIFENDSKLDTIMSALSFGVPIELADEVLLGRNLERIIRSNTHEDLEKYFDHKSFIHFFDKAFYNTQMSVMTKNITKVLKIVNSKIQTEKTKEYWNHFGKEILKINTEFQTFNRNHKELILNASHTSAKNCISKLILTLKENIVTEDITSQDKYYENIMEIEKFLINQKSLISIDEFLSEQVFCATSFINLVDTTKTDYTKYKITCKNSVLTNHFLDISGKSYDLNKIDSNLETLKLIKDRFNFKEITDSVLELVKTYNYDYNDLDTLRYSINIIQSLQTDRPHSIELSDNLYSQLTEANFKDDRELFLKLICIGISNYKTSSRYPNFNNSLINFNKENLSEISSKIEEYMTYNDILKLIYVHPVPPNHHIIKDIAHDITINTYGVSSLNLSWSLENFSAIISTIFDNDDKKENQFITNISRWYEKYKSTNFNEIDIKVFKHIKKEKNNKLLSSILKDVKQHFNTLSKVNIITLFKDSSSRDYLILKGLLKNKVHIHYSDAFYSAYADLIQLVLKKDIDTPEDLVFWDQLLDSMDKRKIKSYYTTIRENLKSVGVLNSDEINFFKHGLINYGNLHIDPENVCLKFIIPMLKTNLPRFIEGSEILIPIIQKSKEHYEASVTEIRVLFSEGKLDENINIIESFNLKEGTAVSENQD